MLPFYNVGPFFKPNQFGSAWLGSGGSARFDSAFNENLRHAVSVNEDEKCIQD